MCGCPFLPLFWNCLLKLVHIEVLPLLETGNPKTVTTASFNKLLHCDSSDELATIYNYSRCSPVPHQNKVSKSASILRHLYTTPQPYQDYHSIGSESSNDNQVTQSEVFATKTEEVKGHSI